MINEHDFVIDLRFTPLPNGKTGNVYAKVTYAPTGEARDKTLLDVDYFTGVHLVRTWFVSLVRWSEAAYDGEDRKLDSGWRQLRMFPGQNLPKST